MAKVAFALNSFSLTPALLLNTVCVYVLSAELGNNVLKTKIKYCSLLYLQFLTYKGKTARHNATLF